jgi:DAK2 domain fusion protein YloV
LTIERLDGALFRQLIAVGGAHLQAQIEAINALNVFPVPDGDTGTNMNLTWQAAIAEMNKSNAVELGAIGQVVSRGFMIGARGNSGVILSQLFRGFCKYIEKMQTMTTVDMAAAMQYGVEMAYRVIQRPTEGTILTVAKESARFALSHANEISSFPEFMHAVVEKARETLNKTPEMLPVLKQAGVVDAGGKGLLVVYEGMLRALNGDTSLASNVSTSTFNTMPALHDMAQVHFSTGDIEHGYCTEFMIRISTEKLKQNPFDEQTFRETLEQLGDSLLVVADESLVKVHIHAEWPGHVLNEGAKYGELERIKIDNMRLQHEEIVASSMTEKKPYGVIAVAAGDGMSQLFKSLGADEMIAGGQSMNPSAEQFLTACERLHADTIFVLPNNSNVIMAARQAAEMSDLKVIVLPSKSMQQGIAALVAFQAEQLPEINEQNMVATFEHLQSGALTIAVRDTELDGLTIKTNDFIGLHNNNLVVAHQDALQAVLSLVDIMIRDEHFMLTVYSGEDATPEFIDTLIDTLTHTYGDLEIEHYHGGQPVYHLLLAAE